VSSCVRRHGTEGRNITPKHGARRPLLNIFFVPFHPFLLPRGRCGRVQGDGSLTSLVCAGNHNTTTTGPCGRLLAALSSGVECHGSKSNRRCVTLPQSGHSAQSLSGRLMKGLILLETAGRTWRKMKLETSCPPTSQDTSSPTASDIIPFALYPVTAAFLSTPSSGWATWLAIDVCHTANVAQSPVLRVRKQPHWLVIT
jgi:hypothetical protein